MISCITLELYFLAVSILMHYVSNFGQISCPVLAGHNLWHLFALHVTLFIHTILYYAYYCITIPGRPANTNTTIFFCGRSPVLPSSFYELEVFVGPLFFLFFYRQATMYCLKMIFMENCQFLQSCSTYGPCSNIRLKIPLYGITLYYFYYYYFFYYFIISLWRMYQVARILSWMHVHNCFMKLKMILWITSDFKCYEKLSFS